MIISVKANLTGENICTLGLMPYMLNSEGKTVLEVMRELGEIPALPESIEEDIIEGEFDES